LITGVSGQDGWYLSRLLHHLDYSVTGTSHRAYALRDISDEYGLDEILTLDLTDGRAIHGLIADRQFDEIYNLAAVASSASRYESPADSSIVNGIGVAHILESIRVSSPQTRFCQASSSEVFAGASTTPQDEGSERVALTPYGAAKEYADALVRIYREQFGVFASSAILFSHDSPRRSVEHVVRKITHGVALIASGTTDSVRLGNLGAVRDWGHAEDYVVAMHRMLLRSHADDYVVASGIPHTVRDVCEIAFEEAGVDIGRHLLIDPDLFHEEPVARVGDASKARSELGWSPTRDLQEIVVEMVRHDIELAGERAESW
jgi:GDPmannose 4,6-dehydratase